MALTVLRLVFVVLITPARASPGCVSGNHDTMMMSARSLTEQEGTSGYNSPQFFDNFYGPKSFSACLISASHFAFAGSVISASPMTRL